jgi:hypothetical protein
VAPMKCAWLASNMFALATFVAFSVDSCSVVSLSGDSWAMEEFFRGDGGVAIAIMAPNKILRNFDGEVPKPSSVSSLIEVSPSAFNETADA